MEEISAKLPFFHALVERDVGRGNDTGVALFPATSSADAPDLVPVEGSKQFRLRFEGEFADFIKKECATACVDKCTISLFDSAGKCTALEAK
jgi:hypothetical protein